MNNFHDSLPIALLFSFSTIERLLVPVATRSKAQVYGRSSTEIAGSNPTRGHGCLSVVSVVCCYIEVSATD